MSIDTFDMSKVSLDEKILFEMKDEFLYFGGCEYEHGGFF
jgi:hypothetical protein